MPGIDQYQRMLFELADQRRQNATQQRTGAINKVWCQQGEQKVRVQIGTAADGTPWLTPWLHYGDDHAGSHREEKKIHVGQNVSVTNISGDFRQASVDHHSTNQQHQRPRHATEHQWTEQNDTLRETHGQDFHEHWLAKESGSSSSSTSSTGGDQMMIMPEQKDDSSKAIVLNRIGNPPQNQQDTGQPYDGVPTTGGNPQMRTLKWLKGKGNQPPPMQTQDEHRKQHGDKTHSVMADENIQHKVQKSAGDDSGAARTITEQGKITHHVGQNSSTQMDSGTINQSTGDHYIQGSSSSWLHSPGTAHVHGGKTILTNKMVMHAFHAAPASTGFSTATGEHIDHDHIGPGEHVSFIILPTLRGRSGRLGGQLGFTLTVSSPVLDSPALSLGVPYPGDDYYIENGAYITASYSSPTPPNDITTGIPYDGFRWIDTTSGIEYSFFTIRFFEGPLAASFSPPGPVFGVPSLGGSAWVGVSLAGASPWLDAPSYLPISVGVWSEHGGKVAFPPAPSYGDLFSIPPREWMWNGIGWESTLWYRLAALEGNLFAVPIQVAPPVISFVMASGGVSSTLGPPPIGSPIFNQSSLPIFGTPSLQSKGGNFGTPVSLLGASPVLGAPVL